MSDISDIEKRTEQELVLSSEKDLDQIDLLTVPPRAEIAISEYKAIDLKNWLTQRIYRLQISLGQRVKSTKEASTISNAVVKGLAMRKGVTKSIGSEHLKLVFDRAEAGFLKDENGTQIKVISINSQEILYWIDLLNKERAMKDAEIQRRKIENAALRHQEDKKTYYRSKIKLDSLRAYEIASETTGIEQLIQYHYVAQWLYQQGYINLNREEFEAYDEEAKTIWHSQKQKAGVRSKNIKKMVEDYGYINWVQIRRTIIMRDYFSKIEKLPFEVDVEKILAMREPKIKDYLSC